MSLPEDPREPLLEEVRLERFKAAFRPEAIPLRPFNVVVGRNGSGKSTLLEALQWLATTIRRDAREASDRYRGSRDLMNLRSQTKVPWFRLSLTWTVDDDPLPVISYSVKVQDRQGIPAIAEETLAARRTWEARKKREYVRTLMPGQRELFLTPEEDGNSGIPIRSPDRLSLRYLEDSEVPALVGLHAFWIRAVFLRLSPNRLQEGSLATRSSAEPLLDEEGQNLPALLNELDAEQREELVAALRGILPGIRDVEVSQAELGRDTRVHYSLIEKMPNWGRSGTGQFAIPAWMLSEGTRRITAILALLLRDPPPTLLCIEEIENGLDPWTVIRILSHLQSAADRGTQIIVTTHSPWLLDHVPMDSVLWVRREKGDTRYDRFADLDQIRAFQASIPPGTRYLHAEPID